MLLALFVAAVPCKPTLIRITVHLKEAPVMEGGSLKTVPCDVTVSGVVPYPDRYQTFVTVKRDGTGWIALACCDVATLDMYDVAVEEGRWKGEPVGPYEYAVAVMNFERESGIRIKNGIYTALGYVPYSLLPLLAGTDNTVIVVKGGSEWVTSSHPFHCALVVGRADGWFLVKDCSRFDRGYPLFLGDYLVVPSGVMEDNLEKLLGSVGECVVEVSPPSPGFDVPCVVAKVPVGNSFLVEAVPKDLNPVSALFKLPTPFGVVVYGPFYSFVPHEGPIQVPLPPVGIVLPVFGGKPEIVELSGLERGNVGVRVESLRWRLLNDELVIDFTEEVELDGDEGEASGVIVLSWKPDRRSEGRVFSVAQVGANRYSAVLLIKGEPGHEVVVDGVPYVLGPEGCLTVSVPGFGDVEVSGSNGEKTVRVTAPTLTVDFKPEDDRRWKMTLEVTWEPLVFLEVSSLGIPEYVYDFVSPWTPLTIEGAGTSVVLTAITPDGVTWRKTYSLPLPGCRATGYPSFPPFVPVPLTRRRAGDGRAEPEARGEGVDAGGRGRNPHTGGRGKGVRRSPPEGPQVRSGLRLRDHEEAQPPGRDHQNCQRSGP